MGRKLKLYSVPAMQPVNVTIEAHSAKEAIEAVREGDGEIEPVLGSGGELRVLSRGAVVLEEYDEEEAT